jgi:hypothetical protein
MEPLRATSVAINRPRALPVGADYTLRDIICGESKSAIFSPFVRQVFGS